MININRQNQVLKTYQCCPSDWSRKNGLLCVLKFLSSAVIVYINFIKFILYGFGKVLIYKRDLYMYIMHKK